MPLDREVDLSPGDIVLDGEPAPPKGAQPHTFWPMFIVAKQLNGSTQDATWYVGRPRPT